MKISATVLEITSANCNHCAIRVQATEPFNSTLDLAIGEDVGAGFLPDEWYSTFPAGQEIELDVDFENTLRVDAFRVGDYSRRRYHH
jgi:hypothetical protein